MRCWARSSRVSGLPEAVARQCGGHEGGGDGQGRRTRDTPPGEQDARHHLNGTVEPYDLVRAVGQGGDAFGDRAHDRLGDRGHLLGFAN
ncbi:hypothetical protein SALBM311S_04803 [Streptomyces alboniger]